METYGLSIDDINTAFNFPETLALFESLLTDRNPKQVFQWVYSHLNGNVAKKDLNLLNVLEKNFRQGRLLGELIDRVEGSHLQQGKALLSQNNAKTIMYGIIDGKFKADSSLDEIIEQEIGPLTSAAEIDYDALIEEVINSNPKIMQKINNPGKKGKGSGPVKFLVGEVMKRTNKQGDPVEIESKITDLI